MHTLRDSITAYAHAGVSVYSTCALLTTPIRIESVSELRARARCDVTALRILVSALQTIESGLRHIVLRACVCPLL